MWTSDDSHQPLGIVPNSAPPRGETRLPRLQGGEVDVNMDLPDVHFSEATRRPRNRRSGPGANDLAAMSRKRRDAALSGRADVLDVGITLPAPRALPGTLLKSTTKTVRPRASPPAEPTFAVSETLGGGAHIALEHPEGKTEMQKLQEELRLQSVDLDRFKSALKKKNEEYEGCMALLNVTQAELRLCQERIRTQSPTPPINPPRRLQGVNVFGSEQELAEEAAAYAVSSLLNRVQLRIKAMEEQAKEQEEWKEREKKKLAKKGRQSPLPPMGPTAPSTSSHPLPSASPSTLQTSGNAGRSSPVAVSGTTSPHPPSDEASGIPATAASTRPADQALQKVRESSGKPSPHPPSDEASGIPATAASPRPVDQALQKVRESSGKPSPHPPSDEASGIPATAASPRPVDQAPQKVRESSGKPSPHPPSDEASGIPATAASPRPAHQAPQKVRERPGPPHTGSPEPEADGPPPHTGSTGPEGSWEAQEVDEDAPDTVEASTSRRVAEAQAKAQKSQSEEAEEDAPDTAEASTPHRVAKPKAKPGAAGAPAKTAVAPEGKIASVSGEQHADELLLQCLQEQDQELDEDALKAASKEKTEAYTPAQSPPPDTGGTPTPGPYDREEVEDAPGWQNCSIIRELEVSCAATQTSPIPIGESPLPEAAGKAMVTAQEEVRTLKLVVANSKKEILYYNKVLLEKTSEHQQELQELRDALVAERKRCEEDMKHWKKHVKKELAKDPIMSVALWMWDRELTAMRTRQAFDMWKRKANQIIKARGISGKIAMLATMHQCLRDWRVGIIEIRAQRMREELQQRWFHSLDQATIAWGRELEHGLKTSAMAAWAWQTKYTLWENRAQMKVRQTLQRWFYSSTQAVLHFAFKSWAEGVMEVRLQAFRLQMQGKQAAFHKAVMAFAPAVEKRAIFQAWAFAATADQVQGLSRRLLRSETKVERALIFMSSENNAVTQLCIFRRWVSQVESLKAKILVAKLKASGTPGEIISAMTHFANDQPVMMLQSVFLGWHRYCYLQSLRKDEDPAKRQAIAYCISAFTHASRGVAFSSWKKIVQKRKFQKGWVRFFRPTDDLVPILRAWHVQVMRAEACQKTQVKVEKKEHQNTWFVTLLCFVLWRLKLRPSAAVVSYVPKLARCQEVALRKLGELQVQCSCLVVIRAWQSAVHAQKDEVVAEKAALDKDIKAEVEKLESKNKALEEEMAVAEKKHAEEREQLQQELNKAKKSCCCVVQ